MPGKSLADVVATSILAGFIGYAACVHSWVKANFDKIEKRFPVFGYLGSFLTMLLFAFGPIVLAFVIFIALKEKMGWKGL